MLCVVRIQVGISVKIIAGRNSSVRILVGIEIFNGVKTPILSHKFPSRSVTNKFDSRWGTLRGKDRPQNLRQSIFQQKSRIPRTLTKNPPKTPLQKHKHLEHHLPTTPSNSPRLRNQRLRQHRKPQRAQNCSA